MYECGAVKSYRLGHNVLYAEGDLDNKSEASDVEYDAGSSAGSVTSSMNAGEWGSSMAVE
jgi:hypothetical protein